MLAMPTDRLTASGHALEMGDDALGELRRSDDVLDDGAALRARLAEDGYLYLPGYLGREAVLEARRALTGQMAAEGYLDPAAPPLEALPAAERPAGKSSLRPDLARRNAPLQRLLYGERMLELYRRVLGGPVRHFDYTWLRLVAPGRATPPHCDIVFMGRGTPNLCTAWTPLGDVPVAMGGLLILEGSHRLQRIRDTYGRLDVDSYCENHPSGARYADGSKRWGGYLGKNPPALRRRLGGRWLTADFRAGDLLTFGMFTIHTSLDNRSDRYRLSCDTRYQLAAEPVDERWVGEQPIAHGPAGRRGRIC